MGHDTAAGFSHTLRYRVVRDHVFNGALENPTEYEEETFRVTVDATPVDADQSVDVLLTRSRSSKALSPTVRNDSAPEFILFHLCLEV